MADIGKILTVVQAVDVVDQVAVSVDGLHPADVLPNAPPYEGQLPPAVLLHWDSPEDSARSGSPLSYQQATAWNQAGHMLKPESKASSAQWARVSMMRLCTLASGTLGRAPPRPPASEAWAPESGVGKSPSLRSASAGIQALRYDTCTETLFVTSLV